MNFNAYSNLNIFHNNFNGLENKFEILHNFLNGATKKIDIYGNYGNISKALK